MEGNMNHIEIVAENKKDEEKLKMHILQTNDQKSYMNKFVPTRSSYERKNRQIKKRKNAVILAHYYTPSEVQEIADYVGDSFYLAKIAKRCDQDIIVFCGVKFMGESAKILNPDQNLGRFVAMQVPEKILS